jgi:uncharacterized protein
MPNLLADARSPYLRQHADDPVDWSPWGPDALALARAQERPILLSVGYAACHWCHVMQRESFADPAVASLMNAGFVNIKVDREERPDLDALYMQAVQAFTGGHGGWPMTAFLTPEGVPFFAGTYFPPQPGAGLPSFRQILAYARRLFEQVRAGESDIVDRVRAVLGDAARIDTADPPTDWLGPVAASAHDHFDDAEGGPRGAPKFPPHGAYESLLAHAATTRSAASLRHVTAALQGMIKGGLYDHLGGGFARYSVDAAWRVPHFEKMLVDNAQLAPILLRAALAADEPSFARIAGETLDYLARDLRAPTGGFFAAEDADDELGEGRFYCFDLIDLDASLGPDAGRAAALLGVTGPGTFEDGLSVIRLERPLEALPPGDRSFLVEVAFPALRRLRATRPRPARDELIVTSWNALAISAFAKAGAWTGAPGRLAVAAEAARALLDRARPGGRLHRVHDAYGARVPGFLDDHANLLGALLDLWEATWDPAWLREARDLADATLDLFADPHEDALLYAGRDAEQLVARAPRLVAGPEPAGNGAAALHLTRLYELTDHAPYAERADRILRAYAPLLERHPLALGPEVLAGHWRARGGLRVGIVGTAQDAAPLAAELRRRAPPFAVSARVDPDSQSPTPFMADRATPPGEATAYVCEGFTCRLPTTDPAELGAQLGALTRRSRGDPTVRAPAWPVATAAWVGAAPPPLPDLAGHVVVLDFWTLCCVNCLHVLPELARVEAELAGEPVVVLGVHSAKFPYEQQREAVERAVAAHGIAHPVLLDPDHALWGQYAVRAWPTVVVIDGGGRVIWQRSGEVTADELLAAIRPALADARALGGRARPTPAVSTAPPSPLLHPAKLRARGALDGGDLFVADTGHHQIVRFRLALDDGWPTLTEIARYGSGEPGFADGDASTAALRAPQGLALDGDRLFVADAGNHAIRSIDLSTGRVATVAGTGALGRGAPETADPLSVALRSPWDLDYADGVLFIAMAGSHQLWVLQLEEQVLVPFGGSGAEGHVDGPLHEGALAQPSAVRVWGDRVYFVDAETSSVRALDLRTATLGTLVGHGLFDFGDVDGGPDDARLQHPLGLCVDAEGLLVADTYNHKIKRLDPSTLQIRTVAGGQGALTEPSGIERLGGFALVADAHADRIAAIELSTGEIRGVPIVEVAP